MQPQRPAPVQLQAGRDILHPAGQQAVHRHQLRIHVLAQPVVLPGSQLLLQVSLMRRAAASLQAGPGFLRAWQHPSSDCSVLLWLGHLCVKGHQLAMQKGNIHRQWQHQAQWPM